MAVVDESADGPARQLYLMAAVVFDSERESRVRRDALAVAHQRDANGRLVFHANQESDTTRRQMERIAVDQEAVVTVVRAPIRDHRVEHARQRCVAELAGRLVAAGVQLTVFDSRSGRRHPGDRWTPPGSDRKNDYDLRTISELRGLPQAEVPSNFQVRHVHAQDYPSLWLADAVAWRVRDALQHERPDRIGPLAEVARIHEARRLPVFDRTDRGGALDPSSGLQAVLDHARAVARQAHRRHQGHLAAAEDLDPTPYIAWQREADRDVDRTRQRMEQRSGPYQEYFGANPRGREGRER